MDDLAITGLIALFLVFLPVAIITLAIVVIVVIIALIFLFLALLDQPITAWFFAASLAFNALILAPLWTVSWLAASYEPDLWAGADTFVYVFSGALILPTAFFYFLWQHALEHEKKG